MDRSFNPAGGALRTSAAKEIEFEFEFSKPITPDVGLSVTETLIRVIPQAGTPRTWFGNLELGGKYAGMLGVAIPTRSKNIKGGK